MHMLSRETLQGSVFYLWDQGERVGGKSQVNYLVGQHVPEENHQP